MRYLLALMVSAAIIGGNVSCRADDGIADLQSLPRLPGAVEDPGPTSTTSGYKAPGSVPNVASMLREQLASQGWMPFVTPDEPQSTLLQFKKGPQGLTVFFTNAGGKPERTGVHYVANRINADVPFPIGATEIVFDTGRPYLGCLVPGAIEATQAAMETGLAASGWTRLSAADIATQWPNAKADETMENGVRAYYRSIANSYQRPIMLTLQRADNNTRVDIRLAPFAQPQDIAAGPLSAGLPAPARYKTLGSTGSADSLQHETTAVIPAELAPVLAFYRRELAKQGWKEDSKGVVFGADQARLAFTSAEETATLQLTGKYDLTTARLTAQVLPAVVAARQKAKQDDDNKFMKDALSQAQQMVAASDAKRAAAQPAPGSETPLRALAGQETPVPLPETADNIQFDGAEGRLEFSSTSSVRALAAFHRAAMKPLGWKETPSVINNPNMVVLEFSKAKQGISFTIMQMGAKANITADGSGLTVAVAKPAIADAALEADSESALPVPKQHTISMSGASAIPGGSTPFRRELDVSVPADLGAVLAFYRRELTKRDWKELPVGALVTADRVSLAFTTPDGPAALKLGRRNNETTVKLAVKNPTEAAKAGMMPKPGQAKLLLGNVGDTDATITVNAKTFKVAAGTGGPQTPNGPTLELAPGKYKVAVKIAGRPDRSSDLSVAADDTWGLMVTPGGLMPLQVY